MPVSWPLPGTVTELIFTFEPAQLPLYIGFVAVAILIVLGVVIITEAERPIPITYAKRVRGMKVYGGVSTYLPLRVNQAGVIPIIFAPLHSSFATDARELFVHDRQFCHRLDISRYKQLI